MEVVHSLDELRKLRQCLAVEHHNKNFERPMIGLTPTMGALHRGHQALIERMSSECDVGIVSIFVNPTQFGPNEDLDKYPRTLDSDLKLCDTAGANLVVVPAADEMYPKGYSTTVTVSTLTSDWCGASRPGHFDGVTTVVTKLFNWAKPDRAYFGEKDFQQLTVVRRMTYDLNQDVSIVACPTVREEDGLALSSRNQYLSPGERKAAPKLHEALKRMQACFAGGVSDTKSLVVEGQHVIKSAAPAGFNLEYLAVVDPNTLIERETAVEGDRILVAAKLGSTRLIDNIGLSSAER